MVWATVIKQSSIQVALKVNKITVTINIKYGALEIVVFKNSTHFLII